MIFDSRDEEGRIVIALCEERDRLRKALEFYADPETYRNWDPKFPGHKFSRRIAYDTNDKMRGNIEGAGERARIALRTSDAQGDKR